MAKVTHTRASGNSQKIEPQSCVPVSARARSNIEHLSRFQFFSRVLESALSELVTRVTRFKVSLVGLGGAGLTAVIGLFSGKHTHRQHTGLMTSIYRVVERICANWMANWRTYHTHTQPTHTLHRSIKSIHSIIYGAAGSIPTCAHFARMGARAARAY